MRTRTHGDVETWRCDACGAYTDEPLQVCSECQAKRLQTPTIAKRKKTKATSKARKSESAGQRGSKRRSRSQKLEPPEADQGIESIINNRPIPTAPDVQVLEPTPPEMREPLEMDESHDEPEPFQDNPTTEPDDDVSTHDAGPVEPIEPIQPLEEEAQPKPEDEPAKVRALTQPSLVDELGDHLGLVFVNTPIPELIKRKIEVDFEAFPTISIGRSPENVIVIPDAGVSRTHAELKREGGRVLLTDLGSSNGTYLYDGKEFQRIESSVALGLNCLFKLGTGTILRLVSESNSQTD